MAIDTNITARYGGMEVGLSNALKLYQRTIDFATNGLAAGAWFDIFSLPAGALILDGEVEILTADAGGGVLNVGRDDGHELGATDQAVSSTTKVHFAHQNVFSAAADNVAVSAKTKAFTTLKISVWMLVFEPNSGAASQG